MTQRQSQTFFKARTSNDHENLEQAFPLISPPNSPPQQNIQTQRATNIKYPNRFQKQNKLAVGVQRKGISKGKLAKTNKRSARYDSKQIRIVSFNFPRTCDKFKNKRFDIEVFYRDGNNAKIHRMTIAFGDVSLQEFIDHKDRNRRAANICRLQHTENPFHKNFYRLNLLNGEFPDLFDNFKAMCKNNGVSI